ncbi:hypothetical protein GA0116948_1211 [Chitinophaga costaii]|uniref:Uncharacterized protein n=1 Tax=Chitinophaga costaii TaxID=1335309 RepID=A0A1C4G3M5_9BACT|nr:hypothetical protein [Chitinophaga costaii]PUZ20963.1 hypothetical protein DCM91_17700 [Chitinophaga costaii]SCC62553.1 hypothetical protein GA0116948_1211 [Chitinophaga costaii]
MKYINIAIIALTITALFAACHKAQDTHLPNAFTINETLYATPHAAVVTASGSYQLLTLSSGNATDSTSPKVTFAVDSIVTPWSYIPYDSSSPASYNSLILAEVSYTDSTLKKLTQLTDGTLTIHKTNPTNYVIDYALVYDSTFITGHYSGKVN